MSRVIESAKNGRREAVLDIVKELLYVILITGIGFMYWVAVLLLASLFLVNVWRVSFEQILQISVGLTIVTSVIYCINRVYKHRHRR